MARKKREPTQAELAEWWKRSVERVTPAVIANGYTKQQAVLECLDPNIIILGSRQIGKDVTATGLLWLTSSRTDNVESLFLALVGEQAYTHWRTKWKPFLSKHNIPCKHTEENMMTTFPNGSVVRFAGMDDSAHIESYLGGSMAGGICVLNELQSVTIDLQDLVERILEPALSQTTVEKPTPGRMVLLGTFPETPTGFFWRLWERGVLEDLVTQDPNSDDGYTRFSWSRMENPHLTDNEGALRRTLKKLNTTMDDPQIQKDWLGLPVFIATNRAFHAFNESKNSYIHTPADWAGSISLPPFKILAAVAPPGIDRLSIGIDLASRVDRMALVLWGWSISKHMPLTQLAEAVTLPGADPLQTQWQAVVMAFLDAYGPHLPHTITVDSGSASSVIDFTYRTTKIYAQPALKGPGSKKAGVDRFNDLCSQRQCLVISGSELENDLIKAKWSLKEREKNKWEWSSDHHPDVSDAARYSLEQFLQLAPKPQDKDSDALTPQQRDVRNATKAADATIAKIYAEPYNDNNQHRSAVKSMWGRNK